MMLPPKNSSPAPTPPQAQPAAPAEGSLDQPEEATEQGGDEITLCRYADGTFAVKVSPLDTAKEEGQEAGGEATGPSDEQTLAEGLTSLEEALKVVVKYTKAKPMGGDTQAQFQGGYQGQATSQPQV